MVLELFSSAEHPFYNLHVRLVMALKAVDSDVRFAPDLVPGQSFKRLKTAHQFTM